MKYWGKVGEYPNWNNPYHVSLMNLIYQLMEIRGKPQCPRIIYARNIEIYQSQSPNPRLTSRAGTLTQKATFLTLGQEHSTNVPKQWRKCINTSYKIQWQLTPIHHDWYPSHLHRPRDYYHHWFGHWNPKNIFIDYLPLEKEHQWIHPPKSEE